MCFILNEDIFTSINVNRFIKMQPGQARINQNQDRSMLGLINMLVSRLWEVYTLYNAAGRTLVPDISHADQHLSEDVNEPFSATLKWGSLHSKRCEPD